MKALQKIFTLVLVMSCILSPIQAKEYKVIDETEANIQLVETDSNVETLIKGIDSIASYSTTTSYPASYSLVDKGLVTSVKSQGSYGTCWAFAALASAESNALKTGKGTLDLSELALAYYTFATPKDTLGLTAGDSSKTIGTTILNAGGDIKMAIISLANLGLLTETRLSYSNAKAVNDGTMVPADSLMNHPDYYLDNAVWFSITDMDTVKSVLTKRGAIATSYYEKSAYYNANTFGYYCSTTTTPNHGITIVGWDDNYSKANFVTAPENDGAWLVKNSWGSNSRNNGYFWISYEDKGLSTFGASLAVTKLNDLAGVYQYDGTANVSKMVFGSSDVYTANIYTAQKNEVLQKVGFYTAESAMSYKVYVFTNCSENDPTSGTLVAKAEGTNSLAGYYTVNLNNKVKLAKGTRFSVVVEYISSASRIGVMVDGTSKSSYYSFTNQTAEGQSFYKNASASNWTDLNSRGKSVRIKAYTFYEPEPAVVIETPTEEKTEPAPASTVSTTVTEVKTTVIEEKKTDTTTVENKVTPAPADTTSTEDKTVVSTETNKTTVIGDVNGDGVINSQDYIQIKNYIMSQSSASSLLLAVADCNGDGQITSADYVYIKNLIMKG